MTEAVRLWGLGQRSYQRGGALIRLADLRLRQGRIEEAERLLDGLDVHNDPEAARPFAAIHFARGETAVAGDILERALEQIDPLTTGTSPLLALLVEVRLAANQINDGTRWNDMAPLRRGTSGSPLEASRHDFEIA